MTPIEDAFPRRPLVLRPGRGALGAWGLALVGVLLFGGFLVMLAIEVVPAIRTDLALRDRAVAAPSVRISEGQCRSRMLLLQSCEMTLSWRGKDGAQAVRLTYMFVEPHMGSWSAQAMQDPARPEAATTDLGLDRLWNRIATAIGGAAFALALIGGLVIAALRAQARSGQVRALSGQELTPVAVRFQGWGPGPAWRVADEAGAVSEWPVRKSDRPFLLDAARGLVLALRAPSGGPAFPLDQKLRFVRLTPEERARVLAAAPRQA
jgi:hypothetical protein